MVERRAPEPRRIHAVSAQPETAARKTHAHFATRHLSPQNARNVSAADDTGTQLARTLYISHTPGTHHTMGAGSSKIIDSLMEGTNFDRDEVDRLRKRFMKLDKDGSGTIDKQEFLGIPGIASNPLATRLMDVFDEDGSGTIDFQEFITGLSAFSGKTSKIDKLKFAFKIYDIDRDGYIGNGELFIVMKMMVGKNLQDEELQQIVDKTMMEADLNGDGRLDFDEFKNAVDSKSVASALTLNMF